MRISWICQVALKFFFNFFVSGLETEASLWHHRLCHGISVASVQLGSTKASKAVSGAWSPATGESLWQRWGPGVCRPL